MFVEDAIDSPTLEMRFEGTFTFYIAHYNKMLDKKKFLIIGGILAVVVIVVTLVVVLTRKKDASGGGGGGDNFSPCGNIVTLPNGTQAICPIGWDNRWTTRKNDMKNPNLVRIAAECDEDKDQCMACIGPLYVKTDQLVE